MNQTRRPPRLADVVRSAAERQGITVAELLDRFRAGIADESEVWEVYLRDRPEVSRASAQAALATLDAER
jgi:hypothetical protein